ncbi:hypothetical protein [Terasakiella pusilla]|uniref:hypothetical protein n=1 Tax=Terasakiella pusilla TaxID=64973 RepID=UPI003AA9AC39
MYRLFVFLIVGLFNLAFLADSKAQTTVNAAPDFSTITLSEYGLKVPHPGISAILPLYAEEIPSEQKISISNFLKAFVLTYSAQYIRAHEKYLSDNNSSPLFMSDLKVAKDWCVQILWQPPEEIRKISESEASYRLAFMLAHRAEKMESRHDTYDYYFENSPKPENLADHEYILNYVFDRAQLNYRPAMLELAKAYLEGKKLPQSYSKSYFWYLNAEWEGANVTNHIENLKSKLKPSQISAMEKLFSKGLYPNLIEENEKRNPMLDINERRTPPYLDEP